MTVQLTVVVLRHIARQPDKINHATRILQAFCRTPYKEINIEEETITLYRMTYNLRFEKILANLTLMNVHFLFTGHLPDYGRVTLSVNQ